MKRLRDVFYISANFDENYITYCGMEFHEFIRHCPVSLENLLITDGKSIANHNNMNWFLGTVNGREEILALTEKDLYRLGDFHWIDYNNEEDLNNCTPEEKAEVLYLSHFSEPLKSPFFSRFNNNFVYLAHDDGWYCKLYCRDMSVFADIITNKIIAGISTNKRRKIYPMDEGTKNYMLELTKEGLLIDFSSIKRVYNSIKLNYYAIGHYRNINEMYNSLERSKQRAEIKGYIEHKNKTWKVYRQ